MRSLLAAVSRLRDGDALHLPGPEPLRRRMTRKSDSTEIGQLLTEFGLLPKL